MSVTDAIDALAAFIPASTTLPPHQTQLYARPLVVTPAMCPLLALFPKERDPQLETTSSTYSNEDVITLAWFEAVPSSLDTGILDPAVTKSAVHRAEAITAALETCAAGLPGFAQQADTTITKVRYGSIEGGVWCSEITMRITTWS
ncbi:hypothetical protein GCM10009760_26270 [Kitasatospora kazusensis]|uniref:DUF3168 domain-containing protein n=1 Tax=Kitasatospora kazusensis TaxID=407974 RepID=A0ABN2ZGA3_9ACTN